LGLAGSEGGPRTVRQVARTVRRGQEHNDRGETLKLVCSLSLERASTISPFQSWPSSLIFGEAGPRMDSPFRSSLEKEFELF
jgi:hypothetical protein